MTRGPLALVFTTGFLFLGGCTSPLRNVPQAPQQLQGVDRFIRLTPEVATGSDPQGPNGYTSLATEGIKTVVCVDGMPPDLAAAQAAGLSLFHVPIGYDRVPDEAAASLRAIAQRDPGTIYIHCHHGRHRGPAVAAIYLQLTQAYSPIKATELLHHCGTGTEYTGLWKSVREFASDALPSHHPPLTSSAPVSDLTERMIAIDRIWDRLRPPADRPKNTVPHGSRQQDALLLWEALREARRDDIQSAHPLPLTQWDQAEASALALRDVVDKSIHSTWQTAIDGVKAQCTACHNAHR